jgi:hypothetical protein
MKFWVCCEVRAKRHEDYAGYALLVEWPSLDVVGEYHDYADQAPWSRVHRKGIRQMTRVGDEIYVLWNNCIQVIDANTLKQDRLLTTGVLLGGHVLYQSPLHARPRLWYNSNVWNSYLLLDENARVVSGISLYGTPLRDGIGIGPAPEQTDAREMSEENLAELKASGGLDQLHLNSFQIEEGSLFGASCSRKTMFSIAPASCVLFEDKELDCPHDFTFVGSRVVVNDSGHGQVVVYSRGDYSRERVIRIETPGKGLQKARADWVRGMLVVDDEHVLVGSAPLSVVCVNIAAGVVCHRKQYSQKVRHTCHGLSRYE